MPIGAGSLNGAPGEAAAWPGVVVALPRPQFTPAEVPGCPVAKTAPLDGNSRQAATVREANTCFICALPFKTMLRIADRLVANALTCASNITIQAVGLDRYQQNIGRAQSILSCPDFFWSCPNFFQAVANFCERYSSKASRSS